VVSSLTLRDYHRTESAVATDDIHIEPGATVEALLLSDVTLVNRCNAPINLLHNRGTIGHLGLANVCATAGASARGGSVVRNAGSIRSVHHSGLAVSGLEIGLPACP